MTQRIILGLLCLLLLAACADDDAPTATAPTTTALPPTATLPPSPPPTATPIPPTPTPAEPMAARVNGQGITLAAFEEELARYELAQELLGQSVQDSSHRRLVLNALIERELLIYEATVNRGYQLTDAEINGRLQTLQDETNSNSNFQAWLESNLWTEASFRENLRDDMLIARLRDDIMAQVPFVAEQIRASYIQLDDFALAQAVAAELTAGADFGFLAQKHSLDRITGENGGDLGYFARGVLFVPELEEAAFALATPGTVSNIISVADPESGSTTHFIVQLVARDPERPLPENMRQIMLESARNSLLQTLQETADINIIVPNL